MISSQVYDMASARRPNTGIKIDLKTIVIEEDMNMREICGK